MTQSELVDQTLASIARAKAETRAERIRLGVVCPDCGKFETSCTCPPADPREQAVLPARFEQLNEDQIAVLDAQDVIERLADRLGSYARLICIAKSLAWIHGEDV